MGKVISHRHALKGTQSEILWAIPETTSGICVYTLSETNSQKIRYVGITANPATRLSHHICDKDVTHKTAWITSVLGRGGKIIMTIVAIFPTYAEATRREELLILQHKETVTNYELTPTVPNACPYYLYDYINNVLYSLPSRSSACSVLGTKTVNQNSRIYGRYLLSKSSNIRKLIKDRAVLKLKNEDRIEYAVSQKHAAVIANCSLGTVNSCANGYRGTAKGWLIRKIGEPFGEYAGKRCVKVKCLNDGRKFNSIKSAAKYYKVDMSMITKICRGKRKAVRGLKFKYR